MRSSATLAAAVFLLLFPLCALSFAAPFAGLPVTRIVLQDDEGRPWTRPEQVLPLIDVAPGDRLSSEAVRTGISYLYLKGQFRDVRVEAFPDGSGVMLRYTLVPVTVVDAVQIKGNHALSKSKILDALPGVEGRELREDRFPEYRAAIATLYQSEGYYDAIIRFRVETLAVPHRVALVVDVEEPRPTLIAGIAFSGNTVFTGRQLLRVMKSRVGKPLQSNVLLDTDMAAILEKYTEAGYPAAKPGPVNISFRGGEAFVLVMGNEGPKVIVRFSGNRAFSDGALRKQILIWSEHDVSDAILESSADKIRNLYRDDGYSDAKVTVQKAAGPGPLDLLFEVQEGRRITVDTITIRGNTYFPTKQIKGEMNLHESGWFSSSPYNEDLIDKDLDYLHDRYVDAGFLAVSVKKKVDFIDNGSRAMVQIDIDEGAQTMTGQIAFEGNASLSSAELLDLLSLKPGRPYNERLVDEDRYRILSAYSNKGFLYARVDVEKKSVDGTVDVKYTITEDRQVVVGRIILRGNERTKDYVITRELLLKPGDAYDYGKILTSQQHIYRLGYFGQVRFDPLHPGEKEYVKDMLLTVEERPAGSVELSVGYGDFDRARGSVEVIYRNLWGEADSATIRGEESNVLKRAAFNYRQPWVLGYRVEGIFGLEWSDSKRLNQDTREVYYQTRRTTTSYGLEKKNDRLKLSLTYQFENVENYNVLPQAIISPEDVGRVRVSSITPALVLDYRDDIFNPHKGSLHGIALKEALTVLGSQADFTKLTVQSSWYLPLTSSVIGALSGRAGLAWPHRETQEIPLHERFYLGGSTTVRGYTQDSVGPSQPGADGTPVPQGGASMAVFNAELRLNPSEGFGIVLFSDAGNVWADQSIRMNDLRASYGAGIRYGTPVGPLRVDYGQKIHRRSGESPGEIHFNIGHTF